MKHWPVGADHESKLLQPARRVNLGNFSYTDIFSNGDKARASQPETTMSYRLTAGSIEQENSLLSNALAIHDYNQEVIRAVQRLCTERGGPLDFAHD